MKLTNRITRCLPDPDFVPAPRYLPPDTPEPSPWRTWAFVVGVVTGLALAWILRGLE
jgi:hypothetical protein